MIGSWLELITRKRTRGPEAEATTSEDGESLDYGSRGARYLARYMSD